jgi:type III secretion system low calcium response chaperone LcrH/SycD
MNIDVDELVGMLEKDINEKKLEGIIKGIMDGHTSIQQAIGINDGQLEVIYSLAYNQYSVDKYEMAIKLFGLLCALTPFNHKYWMGLGASLQMAECYESAAEAYGMAVGTLQEDDPTPCFNAGECYAALGDRENALAAFRLARQYAKTSAAFKLVETKSEQIIRVLEKTESTQGAGQSLAMAESS